jgi:hypothetical protein
MLIPKRHHLTEYFRLGQKVLWIGKEPFSLYLSIYHLASFSIGSDTKASNH